jgi:hypothetical protein
LNFSWKSGTQTIVPLFEGCDSEEGKCSTFLKEVEFKLYLSKLLEEYGHRSASKRSTYFVDLWKFLTQSDETGVSEVENTHYYQ